MKHYLFMVSALSLRCVLVSLLFASPSLTQYSNNPIPDPNILEQCMSKSYSCGDNITDIHFPFWGDSTPEICRHPGFNLSCKDRKYTVIEIEGLEFRVLDVDQQRLTMTLARNDLFLHPCSLPRIRNSALNYSFFAYDPRTVTNITLLYDCDISEPLDHEDGVLSSFISCSDGQHIVYVNESAVASVSYAKCRAVTVPVSQQVLDRIKDRRVEVIDGLKEGFEAKYLDLPRCFNCTETNGNCGFGSNGQFHCTCPKGLKQSNTGACLPVQGTAWKIKVALVITGALMAVMALLVLCFTRWCHGNIKRFFSKSNKRDQDIDGFISSSEGLTAKRCRFSEVKKITKSFKEKLGQGGCGEVYKGNLRDGRIVAVKLLNSPRGDGQEFINEVVSISRTSHVNIVTLLGFCFEGRKRALIYEFMPNGSLEKFVFNEDGSQTGPNLEWEEMIDIATGIARGLEYLHRGCNTRILHFDIKPHNILLDKDLCPKISDFGLAKVCPNKESCVSLLNVRGTMGYVAPEVCNRNFGAVSSKSDVYSYGMMILEMVGGRKNIDIGASRSSQVYFPNWIYKQIKIGGDLPLLGNMTREQNRLARKMILVGLWCIQIKPSDRPSMSKVIEMLEGCLESLRIPPNPTLVSS